MARPKAEYPWIEARVSFQEPTFRVLETVARRQGLSVNQLLRMIGETTAAQADTLLSTLDEIEAGRTAEVLERFRAVSGRMETTMKTAIESREKQEDATKGTDSVPS